MKNTFNVNFRTIKWVVILHINMQQRNGKSILLVTGCKDGHSKCSAQQQYGSNNAQQLRRSRTMKNILLCGMRYPCYKGKGNGMKSLRHSSRNNYHHYFQTRTTGIQYTSGQLCGALQPRLGRKRRRWVILLMSCLHQP